MRRYDGWPEPYCQVRQSKRYSGTTKPFFTIDRLNNEALDQHGLENRKKAI